MKYFFTLLFTAFIYVTNAQSFPWLGQLYGEIPTRADLLDSSMAANKYHSMTRTFSRFNKKGLPDKKTKTYAFQYNNKGFIVSIQESNSKNKKSEKHEYTYRDSFLTGLSYYKNNKLFRRYDISRNNLNKITDIIKTNSKNEIVLKQHNDFDTSLNMLKRVTFFDKKNKEKKAVEYSYYDGKNMKQAKEYRKGKLKKVWNYTCDPAGTNEKKVKEIKVCKNVNVDENGNRVESNRTINPKGEIELRVSTFDRNNKMIKQMVYDDIKHRLKSEWSYLPSDGNYVMTYKNYNMRKQQVYYNKAVFNSRQRIVSNEFVIGRKKKNLFKTLFEYNDKNLISQSKSFDRKNRKTSENIHTYN